LKPRTHPVEETPSEAASRSSIFGGAKPVDTTAKEREIEEKLAKMKIEKEMKREEKRSSRSSRDQSHSGDGEFRGRRDSNRSNDGDKFRRDSEKSEGKENSKEESKEPPQPPVNVWKQRMETQKTASEDKPQSTNSTEDKTISEKPAVQTTETKPVHTSGPPSGRGGQSTRPFSRGGERGGATRGRGRGRGRGEHSSRPPSESGQTEMRSKEEKKERKERKPAEPKKVDDQPPVSQSVMLLL